MDAILERDARTVRVRVVVKEPRVAGCGCAPRHNTATQRLGEVLTLGACLLSLVLWPTAMSAPTSRDRIPEHHPRLWVNPCGTTTPGSGEDRMPFDQMTDQVPDAILLQAIVVQVKNALSSVDKFKNDYVRQTFKLDFAEHHHNWKNQQYGWLLQQEKVPKSLGDQTDEEHLRRLELDIFLRDSYRFLQVMAVALEQVAWDQDVNKSKFASEFSDVTFNLRMVLCEIEMLMLERNVQQHPDVSRDVMSDEFRYISNDTGRHLRDWIIFRDYMIVLEYVKDVYQYFCDHPASVSKTGPGS